MTTGCGPGRRLATPAAPAYTDMMGLKANSSRYDYRVFAVNAAGHRPGRPTKPETMSAATTNDTSNVPDPVLQLLYCQGHGTITQIRPVVGHTSPSS